VRPGTARARRGGAASVHGRVGRGCRLTTCLRSGTAPPAGSPATPPPGPRPRGHRHARPRRGRRSVVAGGELGGGGRAGRPAGVASVASLSFNHVGWSQAAAVCVIPHLSSRALLACRCATWGCAG
jgi:hypothetical protein